jgi:hypothetical protein
VDRQNVSDPLSERLNLVFLHDFRRQCGCLPSTPFRQPLASASAANLATIVVGLYFRLILSCSPRLTKYLTNHLITLLSVGAPAFYHVIIIVRLTSPRIPQVEEYGLNLGFDGYALTSCHRRRDWLSPRAYPKTLLRLF